jgi:hypothetical protein
MLIHQGYEQLQKYSWQHLVENIIPMIKEDSHEG